MERPLSCEDFVLGLEAHDEASIPTSATAPCLFVGPCDALLEVLGIQVHDGALRAPDGWAMASHGLLTACRSVVVVVPADWLLSALVSSRLKLLLVEAGERVFGSTVVVVTDWDSMNPANKAKAELLLGLFVRHVAGACKTRQPIPTGHVIKAEAGAREALRRVHFEQEASESRGAVAAQETMAVGPEGFLQTVRGDAQGFLEPTRAKDCFPGHSSSAARSPEA
mmetsp:Transcript_100888/g.325679  ORF Transcript_100888/g.325679 Transcript_100888/m.325679 type:complete len:224 (-) Transcript_100888:66-737(-)